MLDGGIRNLSKQFRLSIRPGPCLENGDLFGLVMPRESDQSVDGPGSTSPDSDHKREILTRLVPTRNVSSFVPHVTPIQRSLQTLP